MFQDSMFTGSTFTSQCLPTYCPLNNDNLGWKNKLSAMRLKNPAGVSPLSVFSSPVIYFPRLENLHCRLKQTHPSRLLLGLLGVCQLETTVETSTSSQGRVGVLPFWD